MTYAELLILARQKIKDDKLPATTNLSKLEGGPWVKETVCALCAAIIPPGVLGATISAEGKLMSDKRCGPLHLRCLRAWIEAAGGED